MSYFQSNTCLFLGICELWWTEMMKQFFLSIWHELFYRLAPSITRRHLVGRQVRCRQVRCEKKQSQLFFPGRKKNTSGSHLSKFIIGPNRLGYMRTAISFSTLSIFHVIGTKIGSDCGQCLLGEHHTEWCYYDMYITPWRFATSQCHKTLWY